MKSLEQRIAIIQAQEQIWVKEMEIQLEEKTEFLFQNLNEHIRSQEFEAEFCTWKGFSSAVSGDSTWEVIKENVTEKIESRFKELLIEWEHKNNICSNIHKELVAEFLSRFASYICFDKKCS